MNAFDRDQWVSWLSTQASLHLKPIQMYYLVYTCVQAGGCNTRLLQCFIFRVFSYVCGEDCRIFCAYKCANWGWKYNSVAICWGNHVSLTLLPHGTELKLWNSVSCAHVFVYLVEVAGILNFLHSQVVLFVFLKKKKIPWGSEMLTLA